MTIPTTWRDISIGKWLQCLPVIELEKDEIEREVKMLSILTGEEKSIIENLPIKIFNELIKKTSFLNKLPHNNNLKTYLKIDGKKFKITLTINEICAGQFIDLSYLMSKIEDNGVIYMLPEILGVFVMPVKFGVFFGRGGVSFEKYEYEGYDKYSKFLNDNMSMADAYPLFLFFCKLQNKFMNNMLFYLRGEKTKMEKKIQKICNQNGVGI